MSRPARRAARLLPATLVLVALWLVAREIGSTTPASRTSSGAAVQSLTPSGRGGGTHAAPAPRITGAATPPVGTLLPARVTTLWHAPWGGGPTELGRAPANESSPEGPMSFAVDASGRAFVLDQVNERVQVFEEGGLERSIPVSGMTYQDLALRDNGEVVLLDRLGDSAIAFVDGDGRVREMVSLAGPAIPDGGSVTALLQREDGTWVEVEHQHMVRVADADGRADSVRPVVQGRFWNGHSELLRAARVGPTRVAITMQARGAAPQVFAFAEFSLGVAHLTALETDAQGRVYLGASLFAESPEPPYELVAHAEVLAVFEPSGAEIGRLELDAYDGPEERFCTIRVSPDGTVYHLVFSDDGVALRRYEL